MFQRVPLVIVVLLSLSVGTSHAWSEDRGQAGVQDKKPPSIMYPGSRRSGTWIETPGGARVAVGEGVEWQGVKVYLSLLSDLVGVDAKTGETLYAVNVGAFWSGVSFKQVTPQGGTQAWAVELRPSPLRSRDGDRRQYHNLRTGKQLDVPGLVKVPSGKAFKPRAVWSGKSTRVPKPFHAIVTTATNWTRLKAHMFGKAVPKALGRVDFAKEVLLIVSSGNGWNCRGISVAEAYENDARILVRTHRHSFQTMDGAEKVRPWGVVVLPRRAAKAYVVERNRQGLIGGPALWRESYRLTQLGKPAAELAGLPAATDEPHKGWAR